MCKPNARFLLIASLFLPVTQLATAASCDSLAALKLPATTITSADSVKPDAWPAGMSKIKPHAPVCVVAATLRPTDDSDIKIEVWMPETGWNGRFQAVGNGGWSGAINYNAMAAALSAGFAASSTDTGHAGSSASFALGHPEKL